MKNPDHRRHPGVLALACALFGLSLAAPAAAGPPYVTDDPEPTDPGKWEVYAYADGNHEPGETEGETGLDINYGAAKDLQLTLVLPVAYVHTGAGTIGGPGVVEVAAKYRFLHQAPGTLAPDLSFFPSLLLPTAAHRLGSDRLGVFLPVWGQKDFGDWSVFGGGGFQINPGPGNRNFWTGGVALTRNLSERASLGVEIYGHTADERDDRGFTGVNLGATYRMTDHWSVLASGGPGVGSGASGAYDFYVALKADY